MSSTFQPFATAGRPASQSGGPSLTNYQSPFASYQPPSGGGGQQFRSGILQAPAGQVHWNDAQRRKEAAANAARAAQWQRETEIQTKLKTTADPAERAGLFYDAATASKPLPVSREQFVERELALTPIAAQEKSIEASRKAREQEALRAAQSQFMRPASMSDDAFNYVTSQSLANQQRWDAPTFQVWRELTNRDAYGGRAGADYMAGGRSIGSRQAHSSEMDLYNQSVQYANQGMGAATYRNPAWGAPVVQYSQTWRPWESLLSRAPGAAPLNVTQGDYAAQIRMLAAEARAAMAALEQQRNAIYARTFR